MIILFIVWTLSFDIADDRCLKNIMIVSMYKYTYSYTFYRYYFVFMLNELSTKRWYVSFWNVSESIKNYDPFSRRCIGCTHL